MQRADGRGPTDLRTLRFERGFVRSAAGSCLAQCGGTRVICTVSIEEGVPRWMEGRPGGWLTAEYAMLPASTDRRKPRDGRKGGRVDGRTVEIQRLVGRVLRPAAVLGQLPAITLFVDCDVLEADGGTRTTAINGAAVALEEAFAKLVEDGRIDSSLRPAAVGAVSVGVVDDVVLLDLDYPEDSRAQSDMNIVMDGDGRFLEVQASAEGRPFSKEELDASLAVAADGIRRVIAARASTAADGA
ncbi:MAG: ribonuclease PH [Planctomycetes bacterium]|nr:ribonuclease PH [Planctomycetota bacterium]